MNQIEFLLRLSENAREKGNDLAQRHHDERQAHCAELEELARMIELARRNVLSEMQRFGMVNAERPGKDQADIKAIGGGDRPREPARPATVGGSR